LDTGWDGDMLVSNMQILGIDLQGIDSIILSHSHWDHCGGLARLLNLNTNLEIYLPQSFSKQQKEEIKKRSNTYEISKSREIYPKVYTTGEIEGSLIKDKTKILIKEQSLIISTIQGFVVITGCAHSGIDKILNSASNLGEIYALIGGFHDFEEYDLLNDISVIVPTHCTKNKKKIFSLFPRNCFEGGVGYRLSI
jgi:7,8-dihydropterin-6-yl-methyl-4-(beta-D-ribofuranosyl)aminobenzene 5'-phosphate synthase